MDNSLIFTIILGLVVIFYCVVGFFCIKTWKVLHVLLVFAVFLASGFFCVFAAATLKTHQLWREQYNQAKADLEKELTDQQQMQEGVESELEFAADSLRGVEGWLRRAVLDRGRVWRNVTPTGFDEASQSGTVSLVGWTNDMCARVGVAVEDQPAAPVEEPPAEAAPAAPGEAPAEGAPAAEPPAPAVEGQVAPPAGPSHGIAEGAVLQAFKERPLSALNEAQHRALFPDSDLYLKDTQGLCRVPMHYLGEFKVTSASENSLTLQASVPLDGEQVRQIQARDATWVLYEMMPVDSHEAFAELEPESIQALFPQEQLRLAPDRYQRLVSEYARDQQKAQPDDPPERTWMRVKFLKPHKVDVDVEGNVTQVDRDFDPSGRAILATLRQGEPTQFQAGDETLLDGETAAKLIGSGICEKIEPVFVRELRDYEYFYHQLAYRWAELDDQISVVQRDTTTVSGSYTKAQEQVKYRTLEKEKLLADLKGFQAERDLVEGYLSQLQRQKDQLLAQLKTLYHDNNQLLAELTELQRQAVQKVRQSEARAPADTAEVAGPLTASISEPAR